MFDQLFQLALADGIWVSLFTALLFYVLKDSNKREKKYQEIISKLTTHLEVVNDIKEELNDIKEIIHNGRQQWSGTKKQTKYKDRGVNKETADETVS